MQLQVLLSDIEYCIKHPVQIGVQYSNPIERAIRRDFRLADNVVVEAYHNQAIISWPPRTKGSRRVSITVSYRWYNGCAAFAYRSVNTIEQLKPELQWIISSLSFDLCSNNYILFKNIIPKQHLKDFYKYCED